MERRSLLILSLALLPAAAACRKPQDSGPKSLVRFLAGPDIGGGAREIVSQFSELYPDIDVEMVEGPKDTGERQLIYERAFASKEDSFDVVYMDVIWVPKFASQGWVRPLDQWFSRRQQSGFLPGDLAGSRYKGKIYRVPTQSDAGILYYRKDLLANRHLEPPNTFEELVAAAKAVQRPPELWGFVFPGKGEGLVCDFLEVLWGHGGTFLDEKSRVRLEEPPAVEALQWMTDLVQKEGVSPPEVLDLSEEDARRMFQEGRAVFMRNWPYAYGLLQEDRSAVKGQVGFVPMVHGPGRRGGAVLGGWGYGISTTARDPEAAWKFIEFAASAESQKVGYMKAGILPARKALFNDPDIIKGSPHYPELLDILSQARFRPRHPYYGRISEILQGHLAAAISGRESPRAALGKASGEIRKVTRR